MDRTTRLTDASRTKLFFCVVLASIVAAPVASASSLILLQPFPIFEPQFISPIPPSPLTGLPPFLPLFDPVGDVAPPAAANECAYGSAGSPSAGCDFTQPATSPPDPSCFTPGNGLCDANNRIPDWVIDTPGAQSQINQCLGDQSPCNAWYLRMSRCLTCTAEDRARLVGYWQTCRNMSTVANPGAAGPATGITGSGNGMDRCRQNCDYLRYVNDMRHCLQSNLAFEFRTRPCMTCQEVVNGSPDPANVGGGIIGGHNSCNQQAGFCELDNHATRCFGAALGQSWGGIGSLGSHTILGSVDSVGLCHMIQQAGSCLITRPDPIDWWEDLCGGYQSGCGSPTSGANALSCFLACPRPSQIDQICSAGATAVEIGGILVGIDTSAVHNLCSAAGGVFTNAAGTVGVVGSGLAGPGFMDGVEAFCRSILSNTVGNTTFPSWPSNWLK